VQPSTKLLSIPLGELDFLGHKGNKRKEVFR